MGAGAEEQPSLRRHPGRGEPGGELGLPRRGGGGRPGVVELHAAEDLDALHRDPEGGPARHIPVEGHGGAVEQREDRGDERARLAVAALGAGGKAGVGKQYGDAAAFRQPDEVRPDLGLDQHQGAGIDETQDAPGDPGQIDRVVDDGQGIRRLLRGDPITGRGGGAEDDGAVRRGGAQGLEQLQGDEDLAHADGVNPERTPAPEARADLRGKAAEPLGKVPRQPAPAQPLDQKGGQAHQEENGQEEIVEGVDEGSGHRSGQSSVRGANFQMLRLPL